MALAVDAERRHHGDDAVREERLQEAHVDPLDLAGEEVVDALQDPEGVGDHRVRGGRPEVGRREALEDLVGEAVGGGEGQLQRGGVGDPRALEVGGHDAPLLGEGLDLDRRPVDEDGADAERPQHRHVHEDVDEVLVGHGGPVHRHHERLLAELGDVLEDPPEVGRSHAGNVILASPAWKRSTSHERANRIYATCDIGKDALDRLRERGLRGRGLRPGPAAPEGARPREGALGDRGPPHDAPGPDRRGGLRRGGRLGPPGRVPDRGGRRQHRPRRRQPPPHPVHPHPRRADRRHRRVRLLHDGGGRAQALPRRGAGARARVDDLAPLPALARGRGHRPHAGRRRHGPDRPEHGPEGGGLRHGRAVPQPLPLRRPLGLRHRGAARHGPPRSARASRAGGRRSRWSRSRTRCGGPTSSPSTCP